MGMFDYLRSSFDLGPDFTNVELHTKDIEEGIRQAKMYSIQVIRDNAVFLNQKHTTLRLSCQDTYAQFRALCVLYLCLYTVLFFGMHSTRHYSKFQISRSFGQYKKYLYSASGPQCHCIISHSLQVPTTLVDCDSTGGFCDCKSREMRRIIPPKTIPTDPAPRRNSLSACLSSSVIVNTHPKILCSDMIIQTIIRMIDQTIPIPQWRMLNRFKSYYPLV